MLDVREHDRVAAVDVGVDLELESVSLSDFDGRLRSGSFDAALMDIVSAPSLSRVYRLWRSPDALRGLNIFGYQNAESDRWLDHLRFATDDAATRAATGQLQRVLMQDPPALFLAWSERSRAVSRRIVVPGERDRDPYQSVSQWRLAGRQALTEE